MSVLEKVASFAAIPGIAQTTRSSYVMAAVVVPFTWSASGRSCSRDWRRCLRALGAAGASIARRLHSTWTCCRLAMMGRAQV
eukprot:5426423-Prymnesium_polylepis.1